MKQPDIVEQLRAGLKLESLAVEISNPFLVDAASEAADEIERLRAVKAKMICEGCRRLAEIAEDNERLRAAHQRIIDMEPAIQEMTVANLMAAESRAALKDTTP